jgi:ABC-type polysaccharide/polyol phosphate export permease
MLSSPVSNILRQQYVINFEHRWSEIIYQNIEGAFIFVFFGLGFSQLIPSVEGVSYLKYFFCGFIFANVFRIGFENSAISFFERYSNKEVMVNCHQYPVSTKQILLSEIIFDTVYSFLCSILILILGLAMQIIAFYQFSLALLGLLIVSNFVALLSKALSLSFWTIRSLKWIQLGILMPIYFLSGVFLPTQTYSSWLTHLIEISPLTHIVRIFRAVVSENFGSHLWLSLVIFFGYYLLIYYVMNFYIYKKFDEKVKLK